MDINELTLGQIKEITSLLAVSTKSNEQEFKSPLLNKYVLVRTYSAGVHAGWLDKQCGEQVILKDSRRLWSWGSDGGVALSGVAQLGLSSGKKVDTKNPVIHLTNAIEIIGCSDVARKSIDEYK